MKEQKEVANDMALPKEMPKREEKIVNITYPDGSNCDVIFSKLTEPIPKEELATATVQGDLIGWEVFKEVFPHMSVYCIINPEFKFIN